MTQTKRVAANVVMTAKETFEPGVVEIDDGHVTRAYRLRAEQERTEWLGGTIILKADDNGRQVAYHNGKPLK